MPDAAAIDALTARALEAGRGAFGPGWAPNRRSVAPGRIELIGNHTDYNGGPVLAAAIDRFVVVLAGPGERGIEAVAADTPEESVGRIDPATLGDWRNPAPPPRPFDYLRGAVAAIESRPAPGLAAPAALAIAGNVPLGFGVSSSAALCVGLTLALATERPEDDRDLVLIAQEAEHRAGTPCGTMDQSASVAGGVILFDGATLGVERMSPELGDLVFAVMDSGVERSLGASSYPVRVEESRAGLEHARRVLGRGVPHVADLTADDLARIQASGDPLPETLLMRLRHIVTETARVREATAALQGGDWESFGALMTASGRSSATDYAISHPRVEELVAEALAVEGVLGARMMGGGEGGAALALLRRDRLGALEAALRSGYFGRHGMAAKPGLVQACAFAPGASVGPV